MANSLNFNNIKKRYLTVTLADEANTTLLIGMPTKGVMDHLLMIQTSLEALEDDETNVEAADDLYRACAKVMSRNKAGKEITTEFLADLFDFEDILIFFNAYMEFVGEAADEKN